MNLKFFACAILTFAFITPNASALRCMQPDVIKSLDDAKRSDDIYYVLDGTFLVPLSGPVHPDDMSSPDLVPTKETVTNRVIFDGRALTNDPSTDVQLTGFPVDIQISCTGPWCGSLATGDGPHLTFVKVREGDVPVLDVGPCPFWAFKSEPKRIKMIRDCLDEDCQTGEHGKPIH